MDEIENGMPHFVRKWHEENQKAKEWYEKLMGFRNTEDRSQKDIKKRIKRYVNDK